MRCKCCKQSIPTDLDVMTEFLARAMPRRVPNKWDVRDIAEEALAVARAIGYVKSNPIEEKCCE